jgi:GTPase SAR1 family protein
MLSFDLTRPKTLDALEDWLEVLGLYLDEGTPILLVGMKQDLEVKVSEDAIKNFQSKNNIPNYLETSSATGLGVEEAFQKATREIISQKT